LSKLTVRAEIKNTKDIIKGQHLIDAVLVIFT